MMALALQDVGGDFARGQSVVMVYRAQVPPTRVVA